MKKLRSLGEAFADSEKTSRRASVKHRKVLPIEGGQEMAKKKPPKTKPTKKGIPAWMD
jgi:hypothetical protein